MTIKIGINGFGRIGRNVLRSAIQNFSDIEVVGINDLLEPDYLAYMLQYDSVHGRFQGTVAVEMGVTDGWWKYGCAAVVGIDTYGESAPAPVLVEDVGFTEENVADAVLVATGAARLKPAKKAR